MRTTTLVLLLGVALLPGRTALAAPDTLTERVDRVIDRAIAEKRIVGTVVLVAEDGRVVYHRAAGYADREAARPMREETIFGLASMTKTITAAAAMALVERGKLELDAPITRWLPGFQPKLPDGTAPVITVRHLLTHTAGLNYRAFEASGGPYHQANVSDGLDQPGLSLDENLRRIASGGLLFAPGTRWHYSVASDVLGAVVEKAAGVPLPDAVRRYVTAPLAMRETAFTVADRARLVTPYADGTPEPTPMGARMEVPVAGGSAMVFEPGRLLDTRSFPSGGAGMLGTARDYLRLLEALRNGGGPILKPESVRFMTSNQIGVTPDETQGPGWGFGAGFAVLTDPEKAHTPQAAGTFQWGGAFGHCWFVDPVRKLTVIGLTNTTPEGMSGRFSREIRNAVYGVDTSAASVSR